MNLGLIKIVLVLAFSISLAAFSRSNLTPPSDEFELEREILLMPNGKAVQFMSFGYSNLFGDLLWFKTISYFGKHYKGDRSYPWLYHMCDLVTSLNPHASWAYEFCGMMLPWEGGEFEKGIKILTKAIDHDPTNWKYPYLRGFLYLYFLKNEVLAKEDFVRSSRLPGVHPVVVRIAAKKMSLLDDPETATEFLNDILEGTNDPSARKAIQDRIDEIKRGALGNKK